MFSIDDLVSAQTVDQVKAFLYQTAEDLGLSTTAWQKLSPLRTIFAIVARLFSGYTETQAANNRSNFLDFAEGAGLTALAHFVYGVDRNPATFATGTATVDNGGGGLYSFAIGDLVVVNSSTGKTYANTAPVTINPLETGVDFAIQAVEVGSASDAAPGQIDAFASAAPALSVTNATSVLGDDEETDEALRQRCRDALAALSPNGAADAYRYVATTQALNGGIDVTRFRVLPPPGDGTVTVVLAGPDGALSGPEVTAVDTALHALVVREIDTVYTVSADNATIDLTVDVYISVRAGLGDPAVEALTDAAIAAYFPTLPIGGVLLQGGPNRGVPWRGIEGAILEANAFILEATLTPEADTVLGDTDVAIPGSLSVTVHQVGL